MEKSAKVAFWLTVLFGSFGLLYVNVILGVIASLAAITVSNVVFFMLNSKHSLETAIEGTLAIPLVMWLFSVIIAVDVVGHMNRRRRHTT